MTIAEIKKQAEENAKQRLHLIKEIEKLLRDDTFRAEIRKIDSSFIRKIINFPGDITTHRIAKVLSKLK